jgi:hypothetical protein
MVFLSCGRIECAAVPVISSRRRGDEAPVADINVPVYAGANLEDRDDLAV